MIEDFPEPYVIERQRHFDARGWFEELASDEKLAGRHWSIWNMSRSRQGVLRGLHYQDPKPQAKLVRVVEGSIWDVVVDMRPHSPGYGNWKSFPLSAEKPQTLYIPEGFAHGFYTESETALIVYAVSSPRCATSEKVLAWDDPQLAIPWPSQFPTLSARDAKGQNLA